jgi:hypothetical protein
VRIHDYKDCTEEAADAADDDSNVAAFDEYDSPEKLAEADSAETVPAGARR